LVNWELIPRLRYEIGGYNSEMLYRSECPHAQQSTYENAWVAPPGYLTPLWLLMCPACGRFTERVDLATFEDYAIGG
jgi:hypothetical protein